jgi:hypothetical protein
VKTGLIEGVIVVIGMVVSVVHVALAAPVDVPDSSVTSAAIAPTDGIAIGDRYVMPHLPDTAVDHLPIAERTGDRYLAERVALADLVIGERILAAEDLANEYAQVLPGFTEVLLADGFRQDPDDAWFYDPYTSWLRFPLNR